MRCWISMAVLAAAVAAQGPPPAAVPGEPPRNTEQKPQIDALLERVARAHGAESPRAHTAFAGKLEITSTGPQQDKISFVLDIRFRHPNRIRYMVDEGDRRAERGRDRRGSWARLAQDDRAVSLGGREYEGDRRELRKHIGLARQLLRFLDPAEVGRRLGDGAVLGREELRVGRNRTRPCTTISGVAEAFPLYTAEGDPGQVELKLWIDAETHHLLAARSFPLDRDGVPGEVGEVVMMPRHVPQGGLLLPAVLIFDRLERSGARQPAAKVRLLQIDLDPELPDERFDRDRPW